MSDWSVRVLADGNSTLDHDVVAKAAVEDVEAGPPIRTSSPAWPRRVSAPSPPIRTSLPSPPSSVSWIAATDSPEASTTSSPARALTVRRSLAASAAGDVHLGGQAEDGGAGRVANDQDDVVAAGAVDDDVVG